jgi:hypothetical protein
VESTEGMDDTLSGAFAPAIILPAQYYRTLSNRNYMDGERKLMFAVLEDGIRCYLKNRHARSRRGRILFYEVRDWMKPDRDNGPFCFDLLCHEFGMEGSRVRNALERRLVLTKSGTERTAPAMRSSAPRVANLAASRDPRPGINSAQPGSGAEDCEAVL